MSFARTSAVSLALLGLWTASQSGAAAQTRRPFILHAYPAGLQRGQTSEVVVTGFTSLADTTRVLVEGNGVTARVMKTELGADGKTASLLRLEVTAAADAQPGAREFRVATPQGVSNSGTLVIGDASEALENEPNDRPAAAQSVGTVGVVNGRLQADDDRDLYRFSARAGEEISFGLLAARLQERTRDGSALSDAVLILRDAEGQELAKSDDYYRSDPMLPYHFERAGEYLIEVRDARGLGAPNWLYRLSITRRAAVSGVFPLAATRGSAVDVHPLGLNTGDLKPARVELPATAPVGEREVAFEGAAGTLRVSDLPEIMESEGNDRYQQANPAQLPGGISARIGAPFDVDYFRFRAERGKTLALEVEAARLGSSLDSQLAILDARGTVLASNDEAAGHDSALSWTAPADGEYLLQVTDSGSRGGEDYVYHLTARQASPDFSLIVDEDRAQLGPGGGAAWYVRATRTAGFSGEIRLAVSGLPAGVTAAPARIPAGMSDGVIVVNAAPDARPELTAVTITGTGVVRSASGEETITRSARPFQAWYAGGGARNLAEVDTAVACVTQTTDVVITPAAREITLKPGQAVRLEVTVTRRDGFTGPVHLDLMHRHLKAVFANPLPRGVTISEENSKLLIRPEETQGWITLTAAPDARPVEALPLAVLGQLQLNYVVRQNYASPAILLTVPGTRL